MSSLYSMPKSLNEFLLQQKLLKRFAEFNDGTLTSDKTEFFYKEIAAEVIESSKRYPILYMV